MSDAKKHYDYELETVPDAERKGWLPITAIWIAIGIDLSGTILGVQLGAGMPFAQALAATILGSLLLGLFAMPAGFVGAATGFTSAMIARAVFGTFGGRIIALFMAISSLGWFGVQTGFFATNAQTAVSELAGAEFPTGVFVVLGGVLMALTALWGYRSIQRLSSWAVPLLVVLLILGVVLAFINFGSAGLSAPIDPAFSFGGAVSLVMGIFVYGVVVSPDIARWAKTPKSAMVSGFLGFLIGNSFIVIVAMLLSRVMNSDDLMRMFFTLGLGFFALIVLTLAQWTTNTSNLYSAALSLSVVVPHVSRTTLTIVGGVLAIGLAIVGIYDAFIPFISVMGALVAPYGGVYLAEYFFHRGSRLHRAELESGSARLLPVISWALGCSVAFCTTRPDDGLGLGLFSITTIPALDGVLIAFIIQALAGLTLRTDARKTAHAEDTA